MLASLIAAAIALPVMLANAELRIIQPTGAGWVGNSTVTVSWAWTVDDPNFSIELKNPSIQSGLLASGPYAVANNVRPNTNQISFELPVVPPGSGYSVILVQVDNINEVYDESPVFSISDNPSSSSIAQPSQTGNNSQTGRNPTSTRSSATSTSTGVTSTGSILNPFTTEAITTLSTGTPSPSNTPGAAPRGTVASLPAGAIGAVVAGLAAVLYGSIAVV